MKQMINAIDPDIEIIPFTEFFPTTATVEALRHATSSSPASTASKSATT